ncbi:MAG: PAS domain S-box protein [Candidatus Hermodarchaeota archaeon]
MTSPNNKVEVPILLQDNYKLLFDRSPISIVLLDTNGQIVEANSATQELFGFQRENLISLKFSELYVVPDDQMNRMEKIFAYLFKGGIFGPEDIQIYDKDKKLKWVNVIASKIELTNKDYIQVLTQDISLRKNLEQEVEESEKKYRILADSLPEVIFDIDLAFNIMYTNSIASKIFGYTKEELTDMNMFQFVSIEDKELVLTQTKQIFRGDYVKPLTLKLKRKDNTFFFANVYASRIFKKNSVVGVRCIIHDITEMKRAQEKIAESEEKYRLLSENAQDLITVVDHQLKIDYINEKAHKKIMGYSSEDLLGRKALDLIHPDDVELVLEALKNRYKSIELRIKNKKEKYVWMETTAEYYKNPDGKNYVLTIARDISERKEAAQKLVESEKKYKDLANSLPEVIFELDLNFKLVYTNRIASEIFGYSHEDFKKGLHAVDFIHEEEKEEVIENLKILFRGGTVEPGVMRLRKKDGTYFFGMINARPIYKDSKIVGMRSIIHDVTDMVEAERKIKESEEQFRNITEQSLMGISIIQDEKVRYVNNTLADILGYSVQELKNWAPGEFFKTIYPADKKKIIEIAIMMEDRTENDFQFYEARGIHKNGSVIWLDVYNKIIMFQNKPAFFTSYIDITERKKAQEELKDSEEKYRFLFEKSPVSILLIDISGKIEDCNPSLEKLIKYDKKEIVGKKYAEINVVLSEYLPILFKRLKIIASGGSVVPIDIQLRKKDGNLIWVTIESTLVKLGERHVLMVMVHDISVPKELELKLKELNEMRKQFIDRASHELKTPITTVYGAYQLLDLLHKDNFNPEQLELLEMASIGTKRIKKLVDDLLDVSLMESKKFKLNKTKTNLSNIIINCIKEMKYFSNKRNHKIELDILPELNINIDESRIELVITNILSNAIKYTPTAGKIGIKMTSDGQFAYIEIKDSGVGLSKEEIDDLFKKFSTIESPLKKDLDMDVGSTGLGLFLSKEIVKLHQGDIWAESEGKGKGSTFIIKIPIN